jgi:hypothetical protein
VAKSRRLELSRWEAEVAAVSLAGIRPLAQAKLTINAGAEGTHTATDKAVKRVVLLHSSSTQNVHMELNATATADMMPMAPGGYFVVDVALGDVIHIFNSGGSAVTVWVMEIR